MATETTKQTRVVADEVLSHLARMRQSRVWLSAATGIPLATLSRRLNAQASFTIDELVIIARALGVPLRAIVGPLAELEVAV